MHQKVVGNEAILQMEMADDYPDILVDALVEEVYINIWLLLFLEKNLEENKNLRVIALNRNLALQLQKVSFCI